MKIVFDPVSGEKGYFCSELEKTIIDAVINDFNIRNTLSLKEGGSDD